MKKNNLKTVPWIGLLLLFIGCNYVSLKCYYEENMGMYSINSDITEKKNNLKEKNNTKEKSDDEEEWLKQEAADSVYAREDLKLHALASLLMDGSNNRVLYEENGYEKMPMASTTKIMTCIVTIENGNLNDIVTVSPYAARMPDVQLNIRAGEKYYLKDLLYSLMLESHNDVAVAIAEHLGGSVEGFAKMMNNKAKSLGCKNTNFVTPNGLDHKKHYTTARDLAVIASYAIRNKKFIEITNTPVHSLQDIEGKRKFTVSNKNRFLSMMEGAIGIKTGYTGAAGHCFAGAVKRGDKTLISVVLGCGWPPNKSLKWSDTKKLMCYGIDNYQTRQIFQTHTFKPVPVIRGQENWLNISIKGDLSLLMRKEENVNIVYDLPERIQAPVKAGSTIGRARYYIDDKLYAKIPIKAGAGIKKMDYIFCMKKITALWCMHYKK